MEFASIFNKSQLSEIYSLSEEIALSYFNRIHNDVKRMHHACITQRNKGATLRETRQLLVATILADAKRNSSYCSSFSFKFITMLEEDHNKFQKRSSHRSNATVKTGIIITKTPAILPFKFTAFNINSSSSYVAYHFPFSQIHSPIH